ncbi:hypothetical protein ACOMHN_025801 [Nucella lapillus]
MSEQGITVAVTDFQMVQVLGKGAFAKVFAVQAQGAVKDRVGRRAEGDLLALKQIPKALTSRSETRLKLVLQERNSLLLVRHAPFCLQLLCSFQSSRNLYILTEMYSGGSLRQYLDRTKRTFRGRAFIRLAAELVAGLGYIHAQNIVHRDLKPDNIVFDGEGHVVIIDFGLAYHEDDANLAKLGAGTRHYRAPETFPGFRSLSPCNQMADWWSMGVTLLYALSRRNPYMALVPRTTSMTVERLR